MSNKLDLLKYYLLSDVGFIAWCIIFLAEQSGSPQTQVQVEDLICLIGFFLWDKAEGNC